MDVSLKGTSVEPDVDDMEAAYGEGTTPADVLQVCTVPASSGGARAAPLACCLVRQTWRVM